MSTMDERLEVVLKTLIQCGENFKQTNDNFAAMAERMDQQTDAIDKLLAETSKLQAISEVHHFRLRRLEGNEPTQELPVPKQ